MYYYMLLYYSHVCFFFFFKQKTAYEMRISDWSSDVCSSDLAVALAGVDQDGPHEGAAGITDNAGGEVAHRRVGHHVLEVAQRRVLRLQPAGDRLPLQQAGVLLSQRLILGAEPGEGLGLLDDAREGADRLRDGVEERGHHVGDRPAGFLQERK